MSSSGWHEVEFNQGDFGSGCVPIKPTKFGSNEFELPKCKSPEAKGRSRSSVVNSRDLARWCPGLMRSLAKACVSLIFEEEEPKLQQLTGQQPCEAGHVPLRRDCRICQESSAKPRPHRFVKYPDVAGPSKRGGSVHLVWHLYLVEAFGERN